MKYKSSHCIQPGNVLGTLIAIHKIEIYTTDTTSWILCTSSKIRSCRIVGHGEYVCDIVAIWDWTLSATCFCWEHFTSFDFRHVIRNRHPLLWGKRQMLYPLSLTTFFMQILAIVGGNNTAVNRGKDWPWAIYLAGEKMAGGVNIIIHTGDTFVFTSGISRSMPCEIIAEWE